MIVTQRTDIEIIYNILLINNFPAVIAT